MKVVRAFGEGSLVTEEEDPKRVWVRTEEEMKEAGRLERR